MSKREPEYIGGEIIELGDLKFADRRAAPIMEEMRQMLAEKFGVTVSGPYVTLRFGDGKSLKQVHMQVVGITDSEKRTRREIPQ